MIAIIDYKAGNLTSVKRALDALGEDSVITDDHSRILEAERVIFPGVGAAGRAMEDLKRLRLDDAIHRLYYEGKPILGICLGSQIIMEKSQENDTQCLGLIKGEVIRFSGSLKDSQGKRLKVPHMGWNSVSFKRRHPVFVGLDRENEFYFVHSFYPFPSTPENVLGETFYGTMFPSVIFNKNLIATQFHPEKSGRPGLKILENFCRWSGKDHAE